MNHVEVGRFEYAMGFLSKIIDRFGNSVTIERNIDGTPVAFVDSDGHRTGLLIDGRGDLVAVLYPDGGVLRFEYDDEHRMIAKIEPEGNRYDFHYSSLGRIDQVTDLEGGLWLYERTVEDGMPTTIRITAEGDTVKTQRYQNATGYITVHTDAAGGVKTTFKSDDNRYFETQYPCGTNIKQYGFIDPLNENRIMSKKIISTPSGREQEIFTPRILYKDQNGTLYRYVDYHSVSGGFGASLSVQIMDGLRLLRTGEGREIATEYDPQTLLTSRVSMAGLYDTRYQYDDHGRVTGITSGNRTIAYSYDSQGNVATVTDAQNRTTSYTYDSMDRVTSVTRPDESTVRFDWDKNGNLNVLTVPSNVDHGFSYNNVNKNVAYNPPLSSSYRYEYDRSRRLKRTIFPSGAAIENVYENGQLRRVKTPEGDVVMDYLCSSKIGTITMGTESLNYEYDGPLVTSLLQGGELNALLTFGYNETMQLESFGYAEGVEEFDYDSGGLLTTIGDFAIKRDAGNGLPLAVDDGTAYLEREFNGYGEVENQTLTVNGKAVGEVALTRDDVGRIIAKTEVIDGVTFEYQYEYDGFGRLTVVRDGTGSELERYTYGPQGERLTETNVLRGIVSRSFTYDDEDRLLTAGGAEYEFDADGFLTSKTDGSETTTYDYSSRGELKHVELPGGEVVEYRHDPMGRRVAKIMNGEVVEKYLWMGRTTLLAVYNGDGALKSRFLYADGRTPMGMIQDGETYYFAYDQVGSLRAVVDAEGSVVKTVRYDSFGNIIEDTNPELDVPFGFAGGLHDRDTGLVRFGYRDYDPDTGRWTAKDPIGFDGGDVNIYGYVCNHCCPVKPKEKRPNPPGFVLWNWCLSNSHKRRIWTWHTITQSFLNCYP
ncbi:hypothetical protein DPQ33_18220 [Oceanidesulfovibrio indonesiensis]|uniref:Teneurin-like YD-shell domain-containing protein n=1 Tax=Oceanidesulfovibrio indonesiensis TaxID=54767 RepID=A0A7M3MAD6_9BACT|nr:RHS repeat-associated core domain-containing protein [Oceanidesulfovibrio indonesiensis]TVM13563.1 hypothetical protein DPQ33_18220 [Oceanidesulfovibrio indonesiensis]